MKIVFASHNRGKVREVAHLLAIPELTFVTLDDVHLAKFEVLEVGSTYEENAGLKAKTIGDRVRLATVADDSGIEVAHLGGKPGLYSARYAKGSDKDRCMKILKEMEGVGDRAASFKAVIVYYDPESGEKKVFGGEVKGTIAMEARGEDGFGYDPIFIPEGYDKTMAELRVGVKNQISHRSHAVAAMRTWLQAKLRKKE